MIDEWSGFADLLANLIEKYASELDIENMSASLVPCDRMINVEVDKKDSDSSRKQLKAKLLHDIINVIIKSKRKAITKI